MHTYSQTHTHTYSQTYTHTFTYSQTYTHTHTHTLSDLSFKISFYYVNDCPSYHCSTQCILLSSLYGLSSLYVYVFVCVLVSCLSLLDIIMNGLSVLCFHVFSSATFDNINMNQSGFFFSKVTVDTGETSESL